MAVPSLDVIGVLATVSRRIELTTDISGERAAGTNLFSDARVDTRLWYFVLVIPGSLTRNDQEVWSPGAAFPRTGFTPHTHPKDLSLTPSVNAYATFSGPAIVTIISKTRRQDVGACVNAAASLVCYIDFRLDWHGEVGQRNRLH